MQICDLKEISIRDLNSKLQNQNPETNQVKWEIQNPKGGHALAVGIDAQIEVIIKGSTGYYFCLLYTSPSPRDRQKSRMPSSA